MTDILEGPVGRRDIAQQTFIDFTAYLATRAEDPQAIAHQMNELNLMAILNAPDEESMWAADESDMPGGRDLPEVEQTIHSYRVFTATDRFAAPLGHFIIVEASRLSDGLDIMWNTAVPVLIGKIRWLEANGLLPYECVIKGIETPNGTRLRLVPVPRRAVKSTSKS